MQGVRGQKPRQLQTSDDPDRDPFGQHRRPRESKGGVDGANQREGAGTHRRQGDPAEKFSPNAHTIGVLD